MATLLQKKAAEKVLEVIGSASKQTKGEILREVGYSDAISLNPKLVLESEGFKQELAVYGLTEEFITSALVEDIKAKPRKRFFELNLGAEILGMKKRAEQNAPQIPHQTVIIINSPHGTKDNHILAEHKTV